MRRHPTDIIGKRFHCVRITKVLERSMVEYVCDCTTVKQAKKYDIFRGFVKSCGCHHRRVVTARNKANASRDGLTHSYTGSSWNGMLNRCFNENGDDYADYGGAGITVCEYLRKSPLSLITLIGERPRGMSIDRVNNNASYTCGACDECKRDGHAMNVRWATGTQQGRNQRTNHLITISGETKCLAAWAEFAGIGQSCLALRIKRGWTGARLLQPAFKRRRTIEQLTWDNILCGMQCGQ